MSVENIHKDHRKRLRKQFMEHGLDGLSDVNALELLLFYSIPRRDTNPIAHRLLDTFGSLSGVLDATQADLIHHGKLSENSAALLKLVTALCRRQEIDRANSIEIVDTTEKCGDILVPLFQGKTEEQVYALALDGKCKRLGVKLLFSGSFNAVSMSNRAVAEFALLLGASSVVLAHNHPSGYAVPSKADIQTTESLYYALSAVNITLTDHLVVADGDYVSMAQSGMLPQGVPSL